MAKRRAWRNAATAGLIALVAIDGLSYLSGRIPTTSPALWDREPCFAQTLRESQAAQRTYVRVLEIPVSIREGHLSPGWRAGYGCPDGAVQTLPDNTPLMYDVNATYGELPLILRRWESFLDRGLKWAREVYRPGYIIAMGSRPRGKWRVIDTRKFPWGVLSLYRAPSPPRRAWIVHRLRSAASKEAALAKAKQIENPWEEAVVEKGEKRALPPVEPRNGPESASIVRYGHEEVDIEVEASAPGLLVVSDPWYPGWRATVDGVPAEVLPTDVFLRGISVPKGKHVVRMRYRPSSFLVGCVVSLLALAVGVGLWWGLRSPLPEPAGEAEVERPPRLRAWMAVAFLVLVALSAALKWPLWRREALPRFTGGRAQTDKPSYPRASGRAKPVSAPERNRGSARE